IIPTRSRRTKSGRVGGPRPMALCRNPQTASIVSHARSNVETLRKSPVRAAVFFVLLLLAGQLHAAEPADFAKVLAAAKREGKVVVASPPSADLRKQMEAVFKGKFGVDIELVPAPGPQNASRIAAEQKTGAQYFDALIVGTGTALSLAHGGM